MCFQLRLRLFQHYWLWADSNLRNLVAILFLLIHIPAYASWEYITTNDEGADFYVSPDSINSSGWNKRAVWELVNFPEDSKLPHRSGIVQQEYDCINYKVRTLAVATHSENFGKGKVLYRDSNPKMSWMNMPKNSVAGQVRAYICGKQLNSEK